MRNIKLEKDMFGRCREFGIVALKHRDNTYVSKKTPEEK